MVKVEDSWPVAMDVPAVLSA